MTKISCFSFDVWGFSIYCTLEMHVVSQTANSWVRDCFKSHWNLCKRRETLDSPFFNMLDELPSFQIRVLVNLIWIWPFKFVCFLGLGMCRQCVGLCHECDDMCNQIVLWSGAIFLCIPSKIACYSLLSNSEDLFKPRPCSGLVAGRGEKNETFEFNKILFSFVHKYRVNGAGTNF